MDCGFHAEARRGFAVYVDGEGVAVRHPVGRHVFDLGHAFELVDDFRRPGVKLAFVGVLQGVLELGTGDAVFHRRGPAPAGGTP